MPQSADITLVNLNMLFIRYGQQVERELHVPLGTLYLARAMEAAGFAVDHRDYQLCPADDPFDMQALLDFMDNPAKVIGLSCMANLLPFTILAAQTLKLRYPDRVMVLGGVGSKSVEGEILSRFPWIDVICRGEGELTGPDLLDALRAGRDLATVPGISFRTAGCPGKIVHNVDRPRIADLDAIGFPAWEKIDLTKYAGYGMMTSRGCPYRCTFCSVAPVWNHQSASRNPANIVAEMVELNRRAGVNLFLFQDEFFVSGKAQVMDFCRELRATGLKLEWKAFGRVNLIDEEMMQAMAASGCLELRFGVESGSDRILSRIRKGFTAAQVLELIPKAIQLFPRVDTFYVWGFPFETMDDFNQSLFQMISFRMMGARILPSLLSLLPQTKVYRECLGNSTAAEKLEYCPWLLPEFVFTGHEIALDGGVQIPPRHQPVFKLIMDNPDIFPGFFHIDLAHNVLPKLRVLQQFGFYPKSEKSEAAAGVSNPASVECNCQFPSPPRATPQELATRA